MGRRCRNETTLHAYFLSSTLASLCVRVKVGGCGGWLFLRLREREEDRGAQGRKWMGMRGREE